MSKKPSFPRAWIVRSNPPKWPWRQRAATRLIHSASQPNRSQTKSNGTSTSTTMAPSMTCSGHAD
ncbi:hypothetical protein WR31_25580 [Burkholderia contaminans LMG 23361]|uniref:Uncharacterized protein n=1 Tax=Burkholderia contaminans LMG 23361 TaxID=1334628 RepID=A0ABD4AQW8_9BURK|nr:hypothetical protein WR31_25580 [Burkholderia contaminans LMG 23361]